MMPIKYLKFLSLISLLIATGLWLPVIFFNNLYPVDLHKALIYFGFLMPGIFYNLSNYVTPKKWINISFGFIILTASILYLININKYFVIFTSTTNLLVIAMYYFNNHYKSLPEKLIILTSFIISIYSFINIDYAFVYAIISMATLMTLYIPRDLPFEYIKSDHRLLIPVISGFFFLLALITYLFASEYLIHISHAIFIGFIIPMNLLSFLEDIPIETKNNSQFKLAWALIFIAAITRVISIWIPSTYLSHMSYSALLIWIALFMLRKELTK